MVNHRYSTGCRFEMFMISDDKMDITIGFFSQNLVTQMNFVEFRDNQIFHNFRDDECLVDPKNGIFEKKHVFRK